MPVTTNSDGAWYRVAVTIGYCSGCSTAKSVTSTPGITLAGGGASADGSPFALLQPPSVSNQAIEIRKRLISKLLFFISKSYRDRHRMPSSQLRARASTTLEPGE